MKNGLPSAMATTRSSPPASSATRPGCSGCSASSVRPAPGAAHDGRASSSSGRARQTSVTCAPRTPRRTRDVEQRGIRPVGVLDDGDHRRVGPRGRGGPRGRLPRDGPVSSPSMSAKCPVGVPLPRRQAAADEAGARALHEPRLADPGRAEHGHQVESRRRPPPARSARQLGGHGRRTGAWRRGREPAQAVAPLPTDLARHRGELERGVDREAGDAVTRRRRPARSPGRSPPRGPAARAAPSPARGRRRPHGYGRRRRRRGPARRVVLEQGPAVALGDRGAARAGGRRRRAVTPGRPAGEPRAHDGDRAPRRRHGQRWSRPTRCARSAISAPAEAGRSPGCLARPRLSGASSVGGQAGPAARGPPAGLVACA